MNRINSEPVKIMIEVIGERSLSMRSWVLAGRCITAVAQANIWVLEVGKKMDDPIALADRVIELASPGEELKDLWQSYKGREIDTEYFERRLESIVTAMEDALSRVSD